MKAISHWTATEIKYLKENWGVLRIEDMELDRTLKGIYSKARVLGLGPNRATKKKTWVKKDLDYLMDSWGAVSIKTIAKNLNRSESAVKQKAGGLGLGPFLDAGDYITINQLMSVLRGVSVSNNGYSYTTKQWIDKGLPFKKRKVGACSFKIIYLQDWWDWAEENSTIIDFSELEPLALGKEPKWLEEKRRADIEKKLQFKSTPWTKEEDRRLRQMLNLYKYSYRELSLELKRTEGAIKKRVVDLGIKARPLRMPNHNPWTEEEIETLIDLYHKGYCHNNMPNYIPRSAQACRGKIERLIKEKQIFSRNEFRVSC